MLDCSNVARCVQLVSVKEEEELFEAAFRHGGGLRDDQIRAIFDWAENTRFRNKMLDLILKGEIDFWIDPSGEIQFEDSRNRKSWVRNVREKAMASTGQVHDDESRS
jgi:hypothetical protein